MDTTLEVLTTRRSRREAHRTWPDEVTVSRAEIVVGPFTIRLEEGASAARIAAIARALAATT